MKCIRDKETKLLFDYIKKKHSVVKIDEPESIVGEFVIKSIRKYKYNYEVDLEFKGSIWGRGSYRPNLHRYEHTQLSSLSRVKLYRVMRKKGLTNLKSKLSLFGIEIKTTRDISKIKWVG
jgi:hypothetical protein